MLEPLKFIKQQKGTDSDKLPKQFKPEPEYYLAKKYDGHYIQVHKKGDEIKFFTSGRKAFYLKCLADELHRYLHQFDFIFELEFLGDIGNEGKLGNLVNCSTGTYRANFSKGITIESKTISILHDILYMKHYSVFIDAERDTFQERLPIIKDTANIPFNHLKVAAWQKVSYTQAFEIASKWKTEDKWEGGYLRSPQHKYKGKARDRQAIKYKPFIPTTLTCIDWQEGQGRLQDMIGSLVCQDDKGNVVSVGSGMTDIDRLKPIDSYLGKDIKIKYEQFIDTYVKPIFIGVK